MSDLNNILNFNLARTQVNSSLENAKSNDTSSGINVSTNGTGAIKNPSNNREVKNELDKDAFLKLLVTQLKYQDPLEPMDNTQFIAQTAQFTALEQMQNLNATMTNAQAFSVIGKPVYIESINKETGLLEPLYGVVSSVEIRNGEPYVDIGGKTAPYRDIKLVGNVAQGNNGEAVSQAMSLIGKTIQAVLLDSDLQNAEGYIEGKVDFVKFIDGQPILSVGGKDVALYEVVSVSDNTILMGQTLTGLVDGKEVTGQISDVIIKNVTEDGKNVAKVYIKIDENEIQVEDLGSLTSSLGLIGKEIISDDVKGVVEKVIIRDSKPYLVVGDKEVYYKDIK